MLLTAGDPHGIGPEVILKGLRPHHLSQCLIIASHKVFRHYQTLLNIHTPIHIVSHTQNKELSLAPDSINLLDIPYNLPITPGSLSKSAGEHALRCLDTAIHLVNQGFSHTLITGPVNKEAINLSRSGFTGHTEYLAQKANVDHVTMLMLSDKVKVALVTTHIPIHKVSQSLTTQKIKETIQHCHDFLITLNQPEEQIMVCALNPHAGEGGNFGGEEADIIRPAIDAARANGVNAVGPCSADSLFCGITDGKKELYIAMYHDQGLIPFKLTSFGRGVNMTLGLPFIRLSVDHGTAFDIAGQGIARPESFVEALRWANIFNKA